MNGDNDNDNATVVLRPINMPLANVRRAEFVERNSVPGVNIEFFEAVVGKTLCFQELVDKNLIQKNIRRYNRGIVGCALSHRTLWEQCIKNKMYSIICEDDCFVRNDFAARFQECVSGMPNDWDFILLGWNMDSIIDVEIIPHVEHMVGRFNNTPMIIDNVLKFQRCTLPVAPFRLHNAYGMPCYAVSPNGAKKLLDLCFPLKNEVHYVAGLNKYVETFTLDCMLNLFYSHIRAYICLPPIAVVPNDKSTSDIPRGTEWTEYNDEK